MFEPEAREILAGKRCEALLAVVEGAWDKMVEEAKARRRRARAAIVSDNMTDLGHEFLDGLDGVRVATLRGIPMWIFDDRLVVRFKMHKKGLRTENVLTQHQVALMGQQSLDLGLPPEAVNVTCGYVLDAAEAAISRVVTVKHRSRTVYEWYIDMRELASGVLAPTTPPLSYVGPTVAGSDQSLPRISSTAERATEGDSEGS